MRRKVAAALLVLLAALAPFGALLLPGAPDAPTPGPTPAPTAEAPAPAQQAPAATPQPDADASAPLTLYDAAAGREIEVTVEEFLLGAAACEMPPDWPDAALCAQMVASHSYALALGEPMQVNSALCAGWTSAEVLQARWGDAFDEYYARFAALARQVADAVLCYGGAPAAACYHSISAGHTEASQNVWLTALPYLQGVESPWDKAAPGYETTVEYSAEQMASLLQTLGLEPDGDAAAWFGAAERDAAGYVAQMDVCGQTVAGTALRQALGLRAASFTVACADGVFAITTQGYGHGVGLSQYGARAMAQGGAAWQDILTYYFPGCTVERAGA